MKIDSVYVFENKRSKRIEGFTHYDLPNLSKITDSEILVTFFKSEVCFRYAGLAAEKHLFKSISGSDKFPIFLRDGSSDDTLSAAALIKKHNLVAPGRKRYEYKKKIIKETLNDLKDHWNAVTIVSHALFQKKSLNFLELKTLLIKKSNNKVFWKEQFKNIEYIFNDSLELDDKVLSFTL
jgi:hypothetical protein